MPVRGPLVFAVLCLSAACFTDDTPELTGGAGGSTSGGTGDPTTGSGTGGAGVCGDGIVQAGEQCDIGPAGNGACTDKCQLNVCGDGYVGAGESCDGTPGCVGCKSPDCGNGLVDPGEQCDDGNEEPTDACTDLCKQATCGDGVVQAGVEECDDGNDVPTDACAPGCKNAACGDGIVGLGEACDDGNLVDDDGCSNTCATPGCGDGIVSAGEECDDGNQEDGDACLTSCKKNVCGDGVVWAGVEECDDGNVGDFDACLTDCKANVCGDGILDMTEESCDHGTFNDADPSRAACSDTCSRTAYAVFLTSQQYAPSIGFTGVAGADVLCGDLAESDQGALRFKGSRWKAWLATELAGPSTTFFHSSLPYLMYDNDDVWVIAKNWNDLDDGSIQHEIDTTETLDHPLGGVTCTAASAVWTGVNYPEKIDSPNCNDWSTNSLGVTAVVGNFSLSGDQWTDALCQTPFSCSKGARLYCFEQPPM